MKLKKFNYTCEIIAETGWSENQRRDITELISICNQNDHTDLKYYNDGNQEDLIKFLFYDNGKIIAYFAVVLSSSFGKNYAWGTIHPDYRIKEVFSEIFNFIKDTCKEKSIRILNFINEEKANDISNLLVENGSVKINSTYEMAFFKEYFSEKTFEHNNDIDLMRATLEDLEDIVPIGMEAFETDEEDERNYNEAMLNDDKHINFIGRTNNLPIGIVSIRIDDGEGSIKDLGVSKRFRRKGFGRAILQKTVNYMLEQGIDRLRLSVVTNNKEALTLYENCGFRIVKAKSLFEITT